MLSKLWMTFLSVITLIFSFDNLSLMLSLDNWPRQYSGDCVSINLKN